jgi:hypothetical protein
MLADVSTLRFNQSLTFLKSHPNSQSSLIILRVDGVTKRPCYKTKASSARLNLINFPSIP